MEAGIDDALRAAKWALIEAIYKSARAAADFQCSAGNYDRPIAETPWLAPYRYGDGKYDARWYAVHDALAGFHERVAGDIDDALRAYAAVAHMSGQQQAGVQGY